ncbi:uncharacterized protein LOC118272828 isoform X2 [Spodoptera frugiperda]|nr:uncharacterized protein LOC118272828 isoform X2 [Spodoptera frugiperda]
MDPVTKLKELRDAVGRGEIDEVKNIVKWFEQDVDRIRTLSKAYAEARACPTQDDLVIAACSHNQKHVLDYLLSQTDILYYLTDSTQNITEVIEKRTEAVRHALRLEDFEMVVKLYDYWIGDLYWKGHQKDNFEMLRKILNGANSPKNLFGWVCSIFKKILILCHFLTINQQLIINFQSLIKVNDFQQELYNTLPKPLSHYAAADDTAAEGTTVKETARVILNLLSIYDKYSDVDSVRIRNIRSKIENQLKSYFEDKDSIYFRALADIKYEFYFRKVDFNMALLLLEKLYIIRNYLKKHFNTNQLETASNTYREIECAIYHLIYRTSEDWRLYLPADRQLTEETHYRGIYNGVIGRLKTTYDIHKLYNGPVLYFEREHYKTCLRNLKDILNEYFIKPDPANDGVQNNTNKEKLLDENYPNPTKEVIGVQNKTPKQKLLDENYLKPMMEVSDHYSLNKIITYIEALEQTTDANIGIIMIQRVLQVIGEMLKNTGESSHISDFTKALSQLAISADSIKHLQGIRDFLSHADKGQLSIRIDIEDNQADMLLNVKEELVEIKEQIVPIRDLCKLVLDNSLLQKGLDLLQERIEKLPDDAKQRVKEIESGVKEHGVDFVSASGEYYRKVWKPAKLSHQLLKEIPLLLENRDKISSKKEEINKEMNNKIATILPKYIERCRTVILVRICENNDLVDDFNQKLRVLEEEPRNYKKGTIKKLEYIPNNIDIIKRRNKLEKMIKLNRVNQENIKKMKEIIDRIEDLSQHWTLVKTMMIDCAKNFSIFASVRIENADKLEIENSKSILQEINRLCAEHNSSTNNITEACWGDQVSFTAIENLHKNTVDKVTQARTKSDGNGLKELKTCLINRIKRLRATLRYPEQIPLRELVQLYKLDPKFRFVLEMLLGDIENIIKLIKNKPISKKEGKLLEGIVLRNVLYHGNPFLEVIGDLIDSQELPLELLSKAISYADDLDTIDNNNNATVMSSARRADGDL